MISGNYKSEKKELKNGYFNICFVFNYFSIVSKYFTLMFYSYSLIFEL